jgi:hypothetical protein
VPTISHERMLSGGHASAFARWASADMSLCPPYALSISTVIARSRRRRSNPDFLSDAGLLRFARNDEIVGITFQWLLRTDFRQIEARAIEMSAPSLDSDVKTRCA